MARIHTMEDDITYERVRNLPRRTRVCSVHRQLSWACQKEIQSYEKDSKVTTNHIERSKTAMQSRYRELAKVQTNMRQSTSDAYRRRVSCPAVLSHRRDSKEADAEPYLKSSVVSNSNSQEDKDTSVAEKPKAESGLKHLPRSVSMYGTLVSDKGSLNAEQRKQTVVQFNRQQTLST